MPQRGVKSLNFTTTARLVDDKLWNNSVGGTNPATVQNVHVANPILIR